MADEKYPMKCRPHLGAARRLQTGQKIHSSVVELVDKKNYAPKAVSATGEKLDWKNISGSRVEEDLLDTVLHLVETFLNDKTQDRDAWSRIERWLELGEQKTST